MFTLIELQQILGICGSALPAEDPLIATLNKEIHMVKYNQRPTFHYLNIKTNPIRAGGVLIYRDTAGGEREFLLIKNPEGRYEDIGGKTDAKDKSINETISRETEEETNGLISAAVISRQLFRSQMIYRHGSKYLVYLVKANAYEQELKSEAFGSVETHENFHRTIHWVAAKNLTPDVLHPRLDMADFKMAG